MHLLVLLVVLVLAACTDAPPTDPALADAPQTEITGPVPDSTFDRYVSVAFAGQNSASFECSLNGADWVACTSPHPLTNLPMRTHTFRVRALSAQGRPDATPDSIRWKIISVFGAPGAPVSHEGTIPRRDPHGGSFRLQCATSHFAYDDPIVFPGQSGRAHLHMFLGNEQTDFSSTAESMFTTGASTCHGGTLNRSSYWIPAVLAPRFDASGRPLTHADGSPVLAPVSPRQAPHVYYKSGVDDLASHQPLPFGLRMIKGDPRLSGPLGEEKLYDIRWYCESWQDRIRSHRDYSEHIPRCRTGDWVNLSISFPECWDGLRLDSPDHASHVTRFIHSPGGLVCPASHPVPIPKISYIFFFEVTAAHAGPEGDSRHWRISSDSYVVDPDMRPGGYSMHADWFMAWHPEIMESAVQHCIREGRDCAGGELGNGWRLSWFPDVVPRMPPLVRTVHHPH